MFKLKLTFTVLSLGLGDALPSFETLCLSNIVGVVARRRRGDRTGDLAGLSDCLRGVFSGDLFFSFSTSFAGTTTLRGGSGGGGGDGGVLAGLLEAVLLLLLLAVLSLLFDLLRGNDLVTRYFNFIIGVLMSEIVQA